MHSFLTVDLGFGDSGKGTVVDALVRRYNVGLVIRYNGGAQAAHNVVDDKGRHHTFSQFGAGTLAGARTFLDAGVMVNPLLMQAEELRLHKIGVTDAWERMSVHDHCLVTTPYHRALNRLRELARGSNRHGSCGLGIGETVVDFIERGARALRVTDLRSRIHLRQMLADTHAAMLKKARDLRLHVLDLRAEAVDQEMSTFDVPLIDVLDRYEDWASRVKIVDEPEASRMVNAETTVFEGAQGVLIDQNFGFHPYTTWSNTTLQLALRRLKHADYRHRMTRIGVIRSYATRHGPGPFVTEDKNITDMLPDLHNGTNPWQREFRCGWLDMPALHYAVEAVGFLECLAVTHCDHLERLAQWKVCTAYDKQVLHFPHDTHDQEKMTRHLLDMKYSSIRVPPEHVLPLIASVGVPVWMTSHGPGCKDKQFYKQLDEAVKDPVTG